MNKNEIFQLKQDKVFNIIDQNHKMKIKMEGNEMK
jgi:hypothetical protein